MSAVERARREAVAELMLTGLQAEEIAQLLDAPLPQDLEDAKLRRGELLRRVAQSETVEEAAIQAERYDMLFASALLAARQSSTLRQQADSLRLALAVLHQKTNFLTTTGLLPCRTSEVDLRLLGRQAEMTSPTGEFSGLLSDPVRRRQALGFVERLFQAAGDVDEVTDALWSRDEPRSDESPP